MSKPFDLEAEIRDLAARRDLSDVVQRYTRGLDRIDRDTLLSAFHPDAYIDVGVMKGSVPEFVDFALNEVLMPMGGTHHMLGQCRFELHDDMHASGENYFQAWHDVAGEDGDRRDLFVSGRYIDEYECRDGDWRIVRRRLITDWVSDDPANHSYYANLPDDSRGSRHGKDFSQTRDWPAADSKEELAQ